MWIVKNETSIGHAQGWCDSRGCQCEMETNDSKCQPYREQAKEEQGIEKFYIPKLKNQKPQELKQQKLKLKYINEN